MQGKLNGKVAVVKGASSGMGRAIAIALAGDGAEIVLCDLQEKANAQGYEADVDKTTGDIIAARGGDSIFLQTDIASSMAVQETLSRALEASYWAPFCSFADESEEL
ncbi:hypothetical protein CEP52_012540 [Fusarium oligoseptatum]|uniref:Uncharacterized protein n=1 Tax=Fusarium oligoseptatum TaxID=2604345 RepID=A0A428SXU8_9HYPO|nr:hypothetical protein CEP52_012540 [Fusarium oligoseptatum]